MNISCISCPARYGVPDAKLLGKRVRITCKRCGTVLLVDGSVNPPRVSSGANAGPSVAPVARTSLAPVSSPAPAPKASPEFLVVMPDDRQESADVAQIVRLYRDRQINAESLVWRDGMDEWKPVWDVDEISTAFRRMGYARPSSPSPRPSQPAQANYEDEEASTHVVPSSHPPATAFDEDEATSVVDSSKIPFDVPQAGWRQATEEDDVPTGVVPSPMELAFAPDPAPALVQRRSERPAQRATTTRSDRPALAARAAARAEPTPSPAQARVETRARAQTREDSRARQQGLDIFAQQAHRAAEQELAPAVEDDAGRLTGARGENSVLFSLDALVKQEQQKQRPIVLPPRARTDESVLVDSSPSLPSGVVGGGLTAPDFTAPVSAPPPRMEAVGDLEYPQPKKGGWLGPVIALLAVGLIGGAWLSGKLQPLLAAVGIPVGTPSAAASASATPESSAKEEPSAEAAKSAAPETSAAPEASAAPSASAAAAKPVAATGKSQPAQAKAPPTGTAHDEPPPKDTAAKPAGGGGAFDTAAAKEALTAAANNASSCREATGPMGSGKVSITFAPSGRPTSVAVTGDLAGTSVGSCVARLFRAARVPPFSGEPVSVSKAFAVK